MSKKDKNCQEQDNCHCKKEATQGKDSDTKNDDLDENTCKCGKDKCQEEKNNQEKQIQTEYLEKIKNLEDALLRSQAETLNYRKRKDEETARILKYAEEDILKGFLPILDNFERAISMDDNNFGDQVSKFLEGFRLVYNQTKQLLEKFEVKEIECINQEFDPSKEQAIATECDATKPSGTVLKIYQKGYMYKDKVLRTAMVIVNEVSDANE